ncbi:MAG TPA: YbaK/EbsC family protein [Actinomycetota bacterium]|jgi:prolyl-tRNA editing enzyme YbaK/EbsC (Cys-tRNA(Pro) deacylase)|nr:YbaK/EbsC family protein [Actinomycetota bacterium]
MHRNTERVRDALRALGHDADVVEFAESTRTSAEAARAIGTSVAQIVKSMVFTDGSGGVVVLTSGANRVSETKVAEIVGRSVTRADAHRVRELTGYPIGGVPPVGHSTQSEILIDEDLMGFEEVWAAAGTPNAVFRTTPRDLVRITGAAVADVKEPS